MNLDVFKCRCGCGRNNIDPVFATKIFTMLIAIHQRPEDVITSGCRCEKHNHAVGGEEKSQHLTGSACDISALTSYDRLVIIREAMRVGLVSFGIAEKFIHIDNRREPKIFLYHNK